MEKKVVEVEQLIKFKDTLARLVENPELFKKAAEAFERDDTETFRGVLREIGILRFCWLICRWFCTKRIGFVCVTLCPRKRAREPEPTVEEMLEFGQAAVRLMEKEDVFKALFDAYSRRDIEKFQSILKEYEIMRFCVQICRWFSHYYCWIKCKFFCPPTAKITSPSGLACVQPNPHKVDDKSVVSVEIRGIASGGAPFSNYKLEYSDNGGATWRQDAPGSGNIVIVYPDGHRGGVYTTPVGPPPDILGYLETTNLDAKTYSLKLTVTAGGVTISDTAQFQLHIKSILIDNVGNISVDLVNSTRKLMLNDIERAIGGYATIGGSAVVDGCGHRYEKYKLLLTEDWKTPTPGVDYSAIGPPWVVLQSVTGNSIEIDYTGKDRWIPFCVDNTPKGDLTVKWGEKFCWHPVFGTFGPIDRLFWDGWLTRTVTPQRSGKYTILLAVQDDATLPNTYVDYLHIWLDNIAIEAKLDSIGITGKTVDKCKPLSIEEIFESGGILEIRGTAWDDEIESGNLTQPSLNFERFEVRWKKDCDPGYRYDGIQLYPKPPPPPPPDPGTVRIKNDILAEWDITDLVKKGDVEPCAYIIQLRVWDNSRVNDHTVHYVHKELAFTLEA